VDVNNEGFFEPLAQKPVAKNKNGSITWLVDNWPQNCLLYTTPPQRTWVGLTWSDIPNEWVGNIPFMEGAKWAEAKNKEKNT